MFTDFVCYSVHRKCAVLPAYFCTLKTKVRGKIVLNLFHTTKFFPVSAILILKPSRSDFVHYTTFLFVIGTVRQTFRSFEICIKTSAKDDEVINSNENIAKLLEKWSPKNFVVLQWSNTHILLRFKYFVALCAL
jgi:hypothetical protein